jgi:hypothetical protein
MTRDESCIRHLFANRPQKVHQRFHIYHYVFAIGRSIRRCDDELTRPDGKKMPDNKAGQEEVSETFVAGLFQQHFNINSGSKAGFYVCRDRLISTPRW